MVYPIRIRVDDPVLADLLKRLKDKRAVRIPDSHTAQKLGKKLKPVRDHITIAPDVRFYRRIIALDEDWEIDFDKAYGGRKGWDFLFKSIF